MTYLANAPAEHVFALAIDDLYDEAKHWLDGSELENQAQADAVGSIMARLRKLSNDADNARKAEKKPHDDAAAAVQARWKPVIERADRAVALAKAAVGRWLEKQEAERLAMQREAEAEALRLAQEAASISRNTLEDAERHDAAVEAAERAAKAVGRIARATPKAAGDGRAVSLRTYYTTELSDAQAALRWLKEHRPTELRAAILELIEDEPLAMRRAIPGVTIHETRKAA